MPIPTISTLPAAPTRSMSNDEFIAKADAFVASLGTLVSDINSFGSYVATLAASLGVSSADAELSSIAGLVSAADKLPFFTGSGTAALADFTAFGRTIAALADAAALRTAAGVYSIAQVDTAIGSAVTGLLEFKGSTDCSANPNYPAASKGDAYVVTVAGKIGGASGTAVDVGDVYLAKADNAGGTQASVGSSWTVLEHNLAGALLASNNLSDLASPSTALNNLGGIYVIASSIAAATGYIKFGRNGAALITIQWVDATIGANTSLSVNFPTAFASWARAWCAGSSFSTASGDNPPSADGSSASTTAVTIYNGISSSKSTTVFAIGV